MSAHEPSPFCYFNLSPEVIRLAVLMYVKYPLSLRNVEDLLAERGILSPCFSVATAPGSSFGLSKSKVPALQSIRGSSRCLLGSLESLWRSIAAQAATHSIT